MRERERQREIGIAKLVASTDRVPAGGQELGNDFVCSVDVTRINIAHVCHAHKRPPGMPSLSLSLYAFSLPPPSPRINALERCCLLSKLYMPQNCSSNFLVCSTLPSLSSPLVPLASHAYLSTPNCKRYTFFGIFSLL